jgi:hypothetical protein
VSALTAAYLSGFNVGRGTLTYAVRNEAGLQAVAAAAIAGAEPRVMEFGVRCDETGGVTTGPGWDYLSQADPKDYPGYTLVTRVVGGWEPFTTSTEGSDT